jgi:glycosyltransferase involved in cell wall biosynthesis
MPDTIPVHPARLRVLVSAFARSPGGGSERLGGGELVLGRNVVHQLARFHHVTALTHTEHQAAIEESLGRTPNAHLEFRYLALPRWLEGLKNFPGGIQFYAYLWQLKACFVARRLHQRHRFDIFHHVTYANDWMASFIGALLPMPYVRGPGGGAQQVPKAFVAGFSRRGRFWERVRSLGQKVLRHDPFFMLGQRRARAILVCTPEALAAIPKRWRHKAQLFPVNGIGSEDLLLIRAGEHQSSDGARNDGGKEFRVLSAGKLLQLKAFDLAIRAFAIFAANHPEARLSIAGDGPEFARLEYLIHALRLDAKAKIEKWLPREELLKKMASCEVFIFPSLRDGGGAVVIEAMAAPLELWPITDMWGRKAQSSAWPAPGIPGLRDTLVWRQWSAWPGCGKGKS